MIRSVRTSSNQSIRVRVLQALLFLAAAIAVLPAFGQAIEFDQNATPDVITGSGIANGGFTTDRRAGIEIALRGRVRFNESGQPENTVNSNGDGSYSFDAGQAVGQGLQTAVWAFDWSVNSDFSGLSGRRLDQLEYELGLDGDPGPGTDFLVFDPVTPTLDVPFFDHGIGDNTTPSGGGQVASNGSQYASLLNQFNVAQNSWRYDFFLGGALAMFDPGVDGRYAIYLQAVDPITRQVLSRSYVQVLVGDAPRPDAVFVDSAFAGANLGDQVMFTMPGGSDVTAVFGVDAFALLQNGVDAVAAGGTVNVAAADLQDLAVGLPLEINTPGITLSTDPDNPATIRYGHTDFFPVIEVFEENSTILNFIIRRENSADAAQGIAVRRAGTTLRNLLVVGDNNAVIAGITIDHGLPAESYASDVDNVLIEGNTISGSFGWGFGLATRSANAAILGATIRDNVVDGTTNGVFFFNSGGTETGIRNVVYGNNVHQGLTGSTLLFQNLAVLDPAAFLAANAFDQAVRIDGRLSIQRRLQAAIDQALPGDRLVLESDFSEGVVSLAQALTLDGNGFTLHSQSPNFGLRIQGSDVVVENLTVDGAGTFGIHQSPGADNLLIRNSTVRNGGGTGFAMNCSTNIVLENIGSFDNLGNAVSVTNCSNVTINGLTSSGNAFAGGFSAGIGLFSNASTCLPDGTDGVLITGALNIGEPVPFYQQAATGAVTGVSAPLDLASHRAVFGTLATLNFRSLQPALDAALAGLAGDPALAPITYVEGIAGGDFHVADSMSIQAAVDAAGPNATVDVLAGSYAEDLALDVAGLTLAGPNAGIAGDDAGRAAEAVIAGSISLGQSRDGITVDGFRIDSGISGGIAARGLGVFIANNVLRGTPGTGGSHSGIGIQSSAPVRDARFEVTGNDIAGYRFGLSLDGNAATQASLFSANRIGNNERGVQSFGDLHQGGGHQLVGNVIVDNQRGVRLAGGRFTLQGNVISGNELFAIQAGAGSIPMDDLVVVDNQIAGNGSGVLNTSDLETAIDAACNWWGAADGPSGEAPGSGDSVTAKVGFTPWRRAVDGACDGFIDPVVRQSDGRQFSGFGSALADPATLAGDTLAASAAVYEESFTVDRAVSLIGAGSTETIIAGQVEIAAAGVAGNPIAVRDLAISNPSGNGVLLSSNAGFIEFDGVSISNNGISGINVNPDPAAPLVEGVTIRNSSLSNNGSAGIRPSSNSYLADWRIESSNINNNTNTGFLSAGGSGSGSFRIDGLQILASVFSDNGGLDSSPFGGAIWLKTTTGPESFIENVLIQGNLFADNGSSNPNNRFGISYQVRPGAQSSGVVIDNNTFQSTATGGTQVFGVRVLDQTGGFGYRPARVSNNAFVHLPGTAPVIGVFGELSAGTGYAVAALQGNSRMGSVILSEQISEPITRLSDGTLFSTFASAIGEAGTVDGDELRAGVGVYAGGFDVTGALTLSGIGPDSLVTGDPLSTGSATLGVGIELPNGRDGVTIRDLRIDRVAGNCIFGRLGNDNSLIERVQVNACKAAGAGGGIFFNGPVDGITVTASTVTNSTTRGIAIWNGFKSNITITDNEVSGNNCCGIELQDGTASGVTISGNLVTGNGDNGIGVVGLTGGAGPNRITGNIVTDNGRYGIEVKLPNGVGGLDETADGAIVVADNTVALTAGIGGLNPAELRDLAGIAVFRRAIADPANVDLPRGVTVRNNTVTGYRQNNAGSVSDGFGIVVEGVQMRIEANLLENNDVGLQRQSGHQPYVFHEQGSNPFDPPQQDGDQSDLNDDFFGRGNAQQVCAITEANNFAGNGIDRRDVAGAGPQSIDPIALNLDRDTFYCLIQDGIDDALAGETLNVLSGRHTGQLVIDRSMTLLGDSSGIDRPVLGLDQAATGLPALVRVQSPDVAIEGLEFDVDLSFAGQGIRTEGDAANLRIGNNRFVSRFSQLAGPIGFGDRNAIFINPVGRPGSIGSGFDGVMIDNNEITVDRQSGSFTDFFRAGIAMDSATGSLVGNDILAATHDAILRFTVGGSLLIDDNRFRGGGLQLAEFNATGPVTVANNRFTPDNSIELAPGIGLGTFDSPGASSMRLQNNGNAIATTVRDNVFADHTNAIRVENFPALSIENNGFSPYSGASVYRHIIVSNRVNVSNVIAPLEMNVSITGNDFNGGAAGGTAVEFDNLNCCDDVGSATTTATFGRLVVGGADPNRFAGDLERYIVLDDTTGPVSPTAAETEAQPFFADIDALGNVWDGVPGAAQSASQRAATQARIVDVDDNADLGRVILEQPELVISPDSVDFGPVPAGSSGGPVAVVYENTGNGVLEYEAAPASAPFAIGLDSCGPGTVVLQPSQSCSVEYVFAPSSIGSFSETLIISGNDPAGSRSLVLQGRGIAAAAPVATPVSHDFEGVVAGRSASFEFSIENAGDPLTSLTLQAPSITGDASFSIAGGSCASGTVLSGGQACTVAVDFSPTATGALSGSLGLSSDAGGISAALSGQGLAPADLQISPASTDFGVVLTTRTATASFTLSNAGDPVTSVTLDAAALTMASDTVFDIVGGDCLVGSELPGGAPGCTIEVQFAPAGATGAFSGELEVGSDAGPVSASLAGFGELPDWSDDFADPDPESGGFEQDWNFQAFDATLAPIVPETAVVTDGGFLQIRDPDAIFAVGYVGRGFNDTRSSALVNADGFGSGSDSGDGLDNQIDQGVIARFDPATLSGYAAYMRMELNAQELVLIKFDGNNIDPALVDLRETVAESIDPDWNPGRMFEVEIDLVDQPDGSLRVVARALDAETGTMLSRLEFVDPAGDAFAAGHSGVVAIANAAGLNGTFDSVAARSSFASADLDSASIDFGDVQVGFSGQQTVTLTNNGNQALTISEIVISGAAESDYSLQAANCGALLPAGDHCSFEVSFAAAATGLREAAVVVTSSASTSPDPVLLSAEVFEAELAIDPPAEDFGDVLVGQSGDSRLFNVGNLGEPVTTLSLDGITISGDFNIVGGDCSVAMTLAGGEFCTIEVVFAPQTVGSSTGLLQIGSDAAQVGAQLAGRGLEPAALAISPSDHDFGPVTVGSAASFVFSVSNTGDPVSQSQLGDIGVSGNASYAVSGGSCEAGLTVLAGQQSCTVEVRFAPSVLGGAGGIVNVASDAGDVAAGLAGLGTAGAALAIDPASFDFGGVVIGNAATTGFELSNVGGAASSLTVQQIDAGGAGFVVTGGSCIAGVTELAAGQSCSIDVEFAPLVPDSASGQLDVASDAGAVQAQLSGSGISEINLRITAQASPEPVAAGDLLVYSLSIDNVNQIGSASGVTVESVLPAGAILIARNGCVEPLSEPGCTLGTLGARESKSVSITIRVPPDAGDELQFTAGVSGDQTDPNPGNDSVVVVSSVIRTADLAIVIEPSGEFIPAGQDQLQFIVLATSFGPSDVTGAVVSSELGAAFTDIQWTCAADAGGTCPAPAGSGELTDLVDLDAGGSVSFTITASLLSPAVDQEIQSRAEIIEPETVNEPDLSNNLDGVLIRTGVFSDGFEQVSP